MSKKSETSLGRRRFLTGVAVGGAAGAVAAIAPGAKAQQPAPAPAAPAKAAPPSADQMAKEKGPVPAAAPLTTKRTGSDFMVDAIKALDIDYMFCLPGSTFRALHESLINNPPNPNQKPEFITCLHEEASIAMAHGYARMAGKPALAMVHGTVGLMHGSMAIYNAYVDRVPILVLSGNAANASTRRPGVEWDHSVQDNSAMVRDYIKWDDQPGSLQHWAESTVRAYQIATAVPMAPVMLTAETDLQEDPLTDEEYNKLTIPKYHAQSQPQADDAAVKELAKALVAANNPVLVPDRYARTQKGMDLLAQLAETLGAPVVDQRNRMNMANRHPLNHSARGGQAIAQSDFVLTLEPVDLYGTINRMKDQLVRVASSKIRPTTKVARIGSENLLIHGNYQDFQRFASPDYDLAGDAEATMPSLIEAVQKEITDGSHADAFKQRGDKLKNTSKAFVDSAWEEAAYGWDATPISTARIAAEVWAQVKDDDFTLASDSTGWANRLWNFTKYTHTMPGYAAAGVGYSNPAAVGAAMAGKGSRYTIGIVGDGDFMMSPGTLWTAVHHQIPILMIVHNNQAYHQELMHIQRMANRHNRGLDRTWIGTTIKDPGIDYAKMAQSMGMHGEGPVSDPAQLAAAIKVALAEVKAGRPALIDIVSQPR